MYLDVTGTSRFRGLGEAWGELRGHARTASRVQPWALVLISDSPKALTARRCRGALGAGETGSRGGGEAAGTTRAAAEADAPRASFISGLAPAPSVWNTAPAGDGGTKPGSDHTTQGTETRTRATSTCLMGARCGRTRALPPICVRGCVTRTSRVHTPNTDGLTWVRPELPPSP